MSDDPVVTTDKSGTIATITRSQLESEETFIESAIRGRVGPATLEFRKGASERFLFTHSLRTFKRTCAPSNT